MIRILLLFIGLILGIVPASAEQCVMDRQSYDLAKAGNRLIDLGDGYQGLSCCGCASGTVCKVNGNDTPDFMIGYTGTCECLCCGEGNVATVTDGGRGRCVKYGNSCAYLEADVECEEGKDCQQYEDCILTQGDMSTGSCRCGFSGGCEACLTNGAGCPCSTGNSCSCCPNGTLYAGGGKCARCIQMGPNSYTDAVYGANQPCCPPEYQTQGNMVGY